MLKPDKKKEMWLSPYFYKIKQTYLDSTQAET
jgi:hypothetical protein